MTTRIATTRNFITVTSVEDSDENASISSSNVKNNALDIQRTQISPVALHHVNLNQVRKLEGFLLNKKKKTSRDTPFIFVTSSRLNKLGNQMIKSSDSLMSSKVWRVVELSGYFYLRRKPSILWTAKFYLYHPKNLKKIQKHLI